MTRKKNKQETEIKGEKKNNHKENPKLTFDNYPQIHFIHEPACNN